MTANRDYEELFEQVESGLKQRRQRLKQELDEAWERDPLRSSDVLNRMLALSQREQLLGELKARFLAVARAGKRVESAVEEIQSRLQTAIEQLEELHRHRSAVSDRELEQLSGLFSEELGKEVVTLAFPSFSAEDLEALERILDRSKARLGAGVGVRPVDLGEKAMEMRPEEQPTASGAAVEPVPQGDAEADTAAAPQLEMSSKLEEELEEQEGILLADEVVDLESEPVAAPSPPAPAAKPGEQDIDEVVFVDDPGE